MNVKGVGGTYSYIYDASTGKLATKDGSKNEFVDYYNGKLKGEDSKSLNGFDVRMKHDIENMIMIFSSGIGRNPFADTAEDSTFEISGNIVDAVTTEYSVDGQKLFTSHSGMSLSIPEMLDYIEKSQSFERLMAEGNDLTTEQNVHLDFVKEVGVYTDKSAPMSDVQKLVMSRLEEYSYQSLAGRAKENTNYNEEESLHFDKNEMGVIPETTPSFVSKILSRDELMTDWEAQVEKNQYKKKSLYDMLMASCKEGTGAKFKFVGEEKVYNFYEYISEIEKRTRANMVYTDLTEEKKEQ